MSINESIETSQPEVPSVSTSTNKDKPVRVFISNISYFTTEEEVEDFLADYDVYELPHYQNSSSE